MGETRDRDFQCKILFDMKDGGKITEEDQGGGKKKVLNAIIHGGGGEPQ